MKGIYYGAFDASSGGTTPVYDLSSFQEVVHWTAAGLAFDRFGSAEAAGDLLERAQDMARRLSRGAPVELKRVGRRLRFLSRAIMAGRTPEVLEEAACLSAWALQPDVRARLLEEVSTWATPFVVLLGRTLEGFTGLAPRTGEPQWRSCLRLAQWYWQRGHIHLAGQLLREVMVTAVVEVNRGAAAIRDLAARQWAESWLNLQAARRTGLGQIWRELGDCRNDLAHMGFRPHPKPVDTVVVMLGRHLEAIGGMDDGVWSAAADGKGLPAGGRLLLTPLGLSPGVLYTALLRVKPDRTVVITSERGVQMAWEAAARAGADGALNVLLVKDPHAGFAEAEEVARQLVDDLTLQPPDEVWVNLAGGTTMLQYVVTKAAERLRDLVRLVRIVVMVDRRSPEQQRAEPYVLGEMVEVS